MDTCFALFTNTVVHNDGTGLESGLDPKIIWVSKNKYFIKIVAY